MTENGSVLARCERAGLYEALRAAHPDGVPYASTAALVHYLEVQGITPSSHGEWVAWLHHAALSAGRTRLAGELLHAGVDLPWHTVWWRWRPAGVFGAWPGEAGRVDEVGVSATGPTLRLVTARDTTTGKHTGPRYTYLRQEWDAATGAPVAAPVTVRGAIIEGDGDWAGPGSPLAGDAVVFARHTADGWESTSRLPSPPPRCPVSVTHGVHMDGIWVLSGTSGLFAVAVTPVQPAPHRPPFPARALVAPHCRSALWPLPERAAAALRGEGVREDWLEETFGGGSCHRLDGGQLPPGLREMAARHFLTTTGLPEIHGFLHLAITPRGDRPLHEVPWPGRGRDVPRHLRARSAAPSDGPFYELGTWMYSNLLLDGRTGRVLRDTTGGMAEPLAGSSLPQFFAMVRLFDEFRRSHGPDAPDHKDARAGLRAWCEEIDPDAAHGEVWTSVLEGFEFEDGTWDLARYGDDTL
ncbi:SUKH-4 family immunity protein [Streptomyces sp. JW3]|uniref:SUKH-4 family immunity protein n=1 Tax=Streptomyces sp. JW3 TaxID=3456955 RepID=UPI003FA44F68